MRLCFYFNFHARSDVSGAALPDANDGRLGPRKNALAAYVNANAFVACPKK